VQGALLLDVVVRQGAPIFQLLSCEDETLLVRGNTFLILNLGLNILYGVRGLNLQGDSFTSQGLHKDLHSTTQPQNQVQGALLLDVVIAESAPIFQLLASKDKALLVGRNALLVLDLRLHILNGIRGLHFQCDGLARQGFHKDLHASTQPQDKVQGALLLDVVVGQGATIFQLLASKDQTLLVRGNALLVLDLGLHILNGV